jgi:hypothetical protein
MTTRRNNPEDSHLHTRRRESLKSHSGNACCHSVQNLCLPVCYLYKAIILPVVCYGYETWSLDLTVFENIWTKEKRNNRRMKITTRSDSHSNNRDFEDDYFLGCCLGDCPDDGACKHL